MARLDDELRDRLRQVIAEWSVVPESVVLYGSVARGEPAQRSDVDVLAVRPNDLEPDQATWQRQLAELGELVRRWTGRRASVVDMSGTEAAHGLAAGEPFLTDADRDGWLLGGRPLGEVNPE
jgi:predicted nucleotidyltransferase